MTVMACWPEDKNISVLSTRIVDILLTKDMIEIGEESGEIPFNCYGEDILRIKHGKYCYEIPQNLTTKGTLVFLGFTPKEAEVLWQYIINRKPPLNEPIALYPAFGFWKGVNDYLDIKFKNLAERNKPIQTRDSKQLLDEIGLRNDVQLQTLKVKNEGRGSFSICLQDQNPKWVIEWAKRYIKRRWSILAQLENHILSRPGDDWLLDIVRELTEKPIDSEIAYTSDYFEPLLNMDPTLHMINTRSREEYSDEECSNEELSDDEVSGDIFDW